MYLLFLTGSFLSWPVAKINTRLLAILGNNQFIILSKRVSLLPHVPQCRMKINLFFCQKNGLCNTHLSWVVGPRFANWRQQLFVHAVNRLGTVELTGKGSSCWWGALQNRTLHWKGFEMASRFFYWFSSRLHVHCRCGTTIYLREWRVALPDLRWVWHAVGDRYDVCTSSQLRLPLQFSFFSRRLHVPCLKSRAQASERPAPWGIKLACCGAWGSRQQLRRVETPGPQMPDRRQAVEITGLENWNSWWFRISRKLISMSRAIIFYFVSHKFLICSP